MLSALAIIVATAVAFYIGRKWEAHKWKVCPIVESDVNNGKGGMKRV